MDSYHIISSILKTNIEIYYLGNLSPTEMFIYKYLEKHLLKANYSLINLLNKIDNDKYLIVLDKLIYFNNNSYDFSSINTIPKSRYIIIGCSNHFDEAVKILNENNYTILKDV